MRTRIKICGMCSVKETEVVCALGVDAVGFNLYPKSKRYLNLGQLKEIAPAVTAFVTPVLLFVNPSQEEVRHALEIVPNALLQFHGNENPEFCESFRRPWIKAVAITSEDSLKNAQIRYKKAQAVLCDAPTELWGGSGKSFDWKLLSQNSGKIILAGGLKPENVGQAIKTVAPYAVDVCSGVEAEPRKKDISQLKKFIEQVHLADSFKASNNK